MLVKLMEKQKSQQMWNSSVEQCLLFNQEVVGSFPGQCPVPGWRFILPNMKQGLAQSGGQGGDLLSMGLSPGGTLSSGPPQDAQLAQSAGWAGGGQGCMLSHT